MGNYPEAEPRAIIFSTAIRISFHCLLITRKKTNLLLLFSSISLPSSSHVQNVFSA